MILVFSTDEIDELVESTKFKKDEIKNWYKTFKRDCPKGEMSREQFYELYNQLFHTEDKSLVKKGLIFDSFDRNKDERISFKELMTTLSVLRRGPTTEKMEWLFDLYDIDGNNEISYEELIAIADCLRDVGTYQFSLDKMGAIFQDMDTRKKGVVTKEEFLEGVKAHPELMNLFNARQILPMF